MSTDAEPMTDTELDKLAQAGTLKNMVEWEITRQFDMVLVGAELNDSQRWVARAKAALKATGQEI
jgi:hypothetical protein